MKQCARPFGLRARSGPINRADAPKYTGQTGGRQARLILCGIRLAMTTGAEWGPAERFVSGVARHHAINPSVDVQSVPVVSQPRFARMQENRYQEKLTPAVLDYLGSPCRGLGGWLLHDL
jgi:hypothetical protein